MKKEFFERYKGEKVDILLRPNGLSLTGYIDNVFEDCIEFRTVQKSSYIDFSDISALVPPNKNPQPRLE